MAKLDETGFPIYTQDEIRKLRCFAEKETIDKLTKHIWKAIRQVSKTERKSISYFELLHAFDEILWLYGLQILEMASKTKKIEKIKETFELKAEVVKE